MLPRKIDPNAQNHFVQLGNIKGRPHLLFLSRAAPRTPHYMRECANMSTLAALERWFTVRRDRWQQWGELAEAIGADAFWEHMEAALAAEPPELVHGPMVNPLDQPCDLAIGELLAGPDGPRFDALHVHRFASAEMRSHFLDWYRTGDTGAKAGMLLTVGWSEGSDELDRLLDEVAANQAAADASHDRIRH